VRGRIASEERNPLSRAMIACYLPVLRFALRNRTLSILAALLLLVATALPFVRLGSEFMPAIREGDALAMPTTLPGISSTEARRTLQMQDRLLAGFPEVEVVLGKIGRADTALDPAPLAMVETHISLLPEERWPERIVESDWLRDAAAEVLADVLERTGLELDVPEGEATDAIARSARAEITRWLRLEIVAGKAADELRARLPGEVAAALADGVVGFGRMQGLALPEALGGTLRAEWRAAWTGDEIPLRRTTFEELTKEEMHAEVDIPGMPNWWLMPIETRIGMLTTGMRGKVGLKLYGKDLGELERLATELEAVLQEVPGTLSVIAERALGAYYLDLDIDRERCAHYGLTVGDVQDVIETAIGGMTITTATLGRERVPVNVRYPRELRDDPVRLARTLVPLPGGSGGAGIPLGELADISIQDGPPVVKSENGLLLTNVPVDLAPGVDIGGYVRRAQAAIDGAIRDGRVRVPSGATTTWSGQYQLMEEVSERLWGIVPVTLGIILVLIYLNTRDVAETLITMVTLPFALIGGVWLLYWLDYDLSVAVAVGFLALAGLAAETAILMHVYLRLAYERRATEGQPLSGLPLRAAIVEGAVLRVRPKMMTVVTTILALLPILWATGAGAVPMKRMAAPMIGGLVTSTLHTLILIPVYYAMLHEWRARRALERQEASP